MAITIDATVSGSNSNCYVTQARANALLEELPHANDWFTDPLINQAQLLVHATRLIDRYLIYSGSRTITTQALEWPRTNVINLTTGIDWPSSAIPSVVEWACVEWAFSLFADPDVSPDAGLGFRSLRTASYTIEMGGGTRRKVPQVVQDLLLPYGEINTRGAIRLMRT